MILERMSHDMDNRKWESINLGIKNVSVISAKQSFNRLKYRNRETFQPSRFK